MLLAGGLALRLALVSSASRDLLPRPDALEYAAGAANVARGESLAFEIDGHRYPSRYPCGVSLLLAPVVGLTGDPAYAWLGELALGVGSIALAWSLARRVGGLVAAGFAGLIVAISPLHALLSTLVMSEIPSLFVVTGLALLFATWAQRARHPAHLLWIGLLCGFAATLRASNVLIVAPLAAWLLFAARERTWLERARGTLLLLAGCATALALEAVQRRALLGDAATTGYHFWLPEEFASLRGWYNPRFVVEPARPQWRVGNLRIYALAVGGWRAGLWTLPSALAALAGAWFAARRWREPLVLACLLFPLATLAFYLPYIGREPRMLLVALPFLATLAGVGVATVVGRIAAPVARGALLAACGLGAVVGFGARGEISVVGALSRCAEKVAASDGVGVHDELVRAAAELPRGAVVVTDVAQIHLGLYVASERGVDVVTLAVDTTEPEGRSFDEEVRLIRRHGLRPLDGSEHRARVLLVDGAVDLETLAQLRAADRAGRPIELWLTHRSFVAPLLERLARHFELDGSATPAATQEEAAERSLHRFRVHVRDG